MIILSLVERDLPSLRSAILSAPQKAGAIEVRLDALPKVDCEGLPALFDSAPRPIIASCRRIRDGGFYRGSESRRREILLAAARAGAAYVDLEHGSGVGTLARGGGLEPGVGLIVSHHDHRSMPRDLAGLYRRMSRNGDVKAVKIVGTARTPADVLSARDLLSRARRGGPPIISFCMGPPGTVSRIMASSWGSWATYASAGAGKEAAPGQVSLADLIGTYRVDEIDDETRLAGIIGTPLGHTLSPAIHNAAYHAHGLNFRYVPLEIPNASGLSRLRDLARRLRIRGLSVTAPYKISVVRLLDLVEPLARRIGAVNTIVSDGRRLIGFNTDATGGHAALVEALRHLGRSLQGLSVAVVGSGGAARALAHAVAGAGARVVVASRSERPGRALARAVGGRYVSIGRLSRERYEVLINCTPVGMSHGRTAPDASLPVPSAAIKGILVYDVVYTPESTALLVAARERGIATLGGLEMLVRQAAEQYVLFTGRTAPLETMREAARLALRRANGGG